jgi:enoyl-CoA hydratase/carnithine racemase
MDLNAIQTVVRPRVRAEIGAYARVASSPDCGGSWVLPRLVGFRRALEIALLSETFNAEEALRLGLVNWVVPRIELEARTAKLASRLASGPLFAQARIKKTDADLAGANLCRSTRHRGGKLFRMLDDGRFL